MMFWRKIKKLERKIEKLETVIELDNRLYSQSRTLHQMKIKEFEEKLEKKIEGLKVGLNTLSNEIDLIKHKRLKKGDLVRHSCKHGKFIVVGVAEEFLDVLKYSIEDVETKERTVEDFTALTKIKKSNK